MERGKMAVCHECMSMLRRPKRVQDLQLAKPLIRQWTARSFSTPTSPVQPRRRNELHYQKHPLQQQRRLAHNPSQKSRSPVPHNNLSTIHTRILDLTSSALKPEGNQLPSEQRILYVLEQLHAIALSLLDAKAVAGAKAAREEGGKDTTSGSSSATSTLLGSVNARQYPAFLSKASLLNLLSEKAEEILRNPTTFITPAILQSYVEVQTLLHQPSSFPDIFHLYATKAAPRLASNGQVTFTPVSPEKLNAAVDSKTANAALDSAITAHNLPLCIDIIDTSLSTRAFRKSKGLRQALVPFGGLLIAPGAAYALSTTFSNLQTSMDPSLATGVAFAGIMTYLFTVTGLGYVVITTANDQMDRVTWARGVPLWERWVREEERAALDKVAGAWGFKDVRWRGMEEGTEWEELREFIGRRGMCLDKVELMEGME